MVEKPIRYMRELRCALGDIFTHCGKNTVKKIKRNIEKYIVTSTIPKINYNVESYTERTLAFGMVVKDIVWFIDRLNEFGYDVLSVTQDNNIWKSQKDITRWVLCKVTPHYHYFKVRKIEEIDLRE